MSNLNTLKKINGIPTDNTDTQTAAVTSDTTETHVEAASTADYTSQLPSFADFLPEQLLPYWGFIQQYPIAEAAVILSVFWVLAYVIRRYILSLIGRLTDHTESNLDDYIFEQLRAPIFNTVILIGVIISTKSAGIVNGIASYITPVCLTLIVLIAMRAAMNVSATTITTLSRNKDKFKTLDTRTEPLLIIIAKLLALLIGAYIVLLIWGINPVGLLASAGIVGIAFGFAAKDTLANLFSGIFILADRPYKLGDYVNLDSGERGKITYIGIRSTRLLTRDDIEVTVPNGVIGNEKVVNESGGSEQKIRIRIPLQCAYESDLNRVQEVLMAVADAQALVCKYPSPNVRFQAFADSGINVELRCWIDYPADRGRIRHLLFMQVHEAFNEHNIEFPYPQLVISQNKE